MNSLHEHASPGGVEHEVLSNAEIEFLHNELVTACQQAGYGGDRLRVAFLLGFARAVEAAVLGKIGPKLVREVN